MTPTARPLGDLLREWRQLRRMSQLDLACEADISTRHLSFLETGRSAPSREMILHLAERLQIPLRERNTMLIAAGFAPVYGERKLDDPVMAPARKAIDLVLKGHLPYPALAIDRGWNMLAANQAVAPLLEGVNDSLLAPPMNVLRLSLHPGGLAPRIVNLPEWRAHLLDRLRKQIDLTSDRALISLRNELAAYPVPEGSAGEDHGGLLVPFQLRSSAGTLSFFSTTTIFGTPLEITLSELAVEAFYPADSKTAQLLNQPAA